MKNIWLRFKNLFKRKKLVVLSKTGQGQSTPIEEVQDLDELMRKAEFRKRKKELQRKQWEDEQIEKAQKFVNNQSSMNHGLFAQDNSKIRCYADPNEENIFYSHVSVEGYSSDEYYGDIEPF